MRDNETAMGQAGDQPDEPDRQIESRIVARLAALRSSIDTSGIHVGVEHGVVSLDGVVDAEESAARIGDEVSALSGVRALHNHLRVGKI